MTSTANLKQKHKLILMEMLRKISKWSVSITTLGILQGIMIEYAIRTLKLLREQFFFIPSTALLSRSLSVTSILDPSFFFHCIPATPVAAHASRHFSAPLLFHCLSRALIAVNASSLFYKNNKRF